MDKQATTLAAASAKLKEAAKKTQADSLMAKKLFVEVEG